MKKIVIIAACLLCANFSHAQATDYKVVFDMSSRDSISQQAVIREVELIKKYNPDAKLEVVVYGAGMNLVVKDKSIQPAAIQGLTAMKDVAVKVCSMTLLRNKVDKSQLVQGVEVVPDGIYEIITKQKDGWGYIKVAH